MNPYKIEDFQFQPGFESTTFTTISGIQYYAYFQDISEGGIKIYSFAFEPVGLAMNDNFPLDSRVGDTIALILNTFFSSDNREIVIYNPHEEDARRMRLFDIWFCKHLPKMTCGMLEKDRVTFKFDTNTLITIGMIYKSNSREIAQSILRTGDLAERWANKT